MRNLLFTAIACLAPYVIRGEARFRMWHPFCFPMKPVNDGVNR